MLGEDISSMFGGMEVHGSYFEAYYKAQGSLRYVVERKHLLCRDIDRRLIRQFPDVRSVADFLSAQGVGVLFFNSGHWIEDLSQLRGNGLRHARFIMRSGGNEIVKAPLTDMNLPLKYRQGQWAESINNNIDFLVVNSSYSAIRARDIGVSEGLIMLARGGVDLQACEQNRRLYRKNRETFVRKFGCGGTTLLGIVSRLEPFKGILPVLSILCRHQSMDWHLVIVGDGSQKQEILEYLRSSFAPQKYTFIGNVDHQTSMRIISLVDWILNCSLEYKRKSGEGYYVHTETMGRTMVESICQGTPIVATSVGGIRELFYENDFPGIMLESIGELESLLPTIVLDRHRVAPTRAMVAYSWQSIFDGLYMQLMTLPPAAHMRSALVIDIDGTVVQDFLGTSDNERNLARVLDLRHKCAIILNTARGYAEVLKAYPSVSRCKDELCIIADCGSRVCVFGTLLQFGGLLPGPSAAVEREVEKRLSAYGCVLRGCRPINRMYVNYKIEGDVTCVERSFNSECKDLGFELCHNDRNLKLVSRQVNKGRALGFVLRHCVRSAYVVGAGDNVLDVSFLAYCDSRYYVNCALNAGDGVHVRVSSQHDMDEFLQRIECDVCEE